MGTSPPSQQHCVAQPPEIAPQYQAQGFQASVDGGFSQTRHQHQYEQDLATLILRSINTKPQDTFMFVGNQEHTNTTDGFSQQAYMAPYPDSMNPHYLEYTPMPVPPMDSNIDPDLMMNDLSMDGTQSYGDLT